MSSNKNRDGFFARSDAGRNLFLLAREVESSFRKMENMLQSNNPSIERFEKKMEIWKDVDALLEKADKGIREELRKLSEV